MRSRSSSLGASPQDEANFQAKSHQSQDERENLQPDVSQFDPRLAHPSPSHPHAILQLQRQHGNRYVSQMLQQSQSSRPAPIQAKMTLGAVGDQYEQEADQVAKQVVDQINAPTSASSIPNQTVQRQAMTDEDDELRMKFLKPLIQRKALVGKGAVSPETESAINQAKGSGKPLDQSIRQPMEKAFGADFSNVKVHTDAQSNQLNQSIQARAFTTGKNIFFNQGEYNPKSQAGQELIAHELTHVVQQNSNNSNASTPTVIQRTPKILKKILRALHLLRPSRQQPQQQELQDIEVEESYNQEGQGQQEGQRQPIRDKGKQRLTTNNQNAVENQRNSELKPIQQLMGGHKGQVYVLDQGNGEKIVIKFQNEEPKEAIIGTKIMKEVGANTPDIHEATEEDWEYINNFLNKYKDGEYKEIVEEFKAAKDKIKHTLVMDFAHGITIKEMMNENAENLINALQNSQFQEDLGKILAADAFAGNPDRAMATLGYRSEQSVFTGWYHEQNLLIDEAGQKFSAIAIDNAFAPSLYLCFYRRLPYGQRVAWAGLQIGSVAAANKNYFKKEVKLIFERIIEEIKRCQKKNNQKEINKELINLLNNNKDEFVKNVADSAAKAIKQLLRRGQRRKAMLRKAGASDKDIESFRIRKRYMRLIAGGVYPQNAHKIAQDTKDYRKWVLMTEFKKEEDFAENHAQSEEKYKLYMLSEEILIELARLQSIINELVSENKHEDEQKDDTN